MIDFTQSTYSQLNAMKNKVTKFIIGFVQNALSAYSYNGVWLPEKEIRQVYRIKDEESGLSLSFLGFYDNGLIIESGSDMVYKPYQSFSVEELMLISYWVENFVEQARQEVEAQREMKKRMKQLEDIFDLNTTLEFSV